MNFENETLRRSWHSLSGELSRLGLGPHLEREEETGGVLTANLLGLARGGSGERGTTSGFSGSDARRLFKSLLTSDSGKRLIREALSKIDRESERVRNVKAAFIRGLLRARRDLYGASDDQRRDLMRIIFSDGEIAHV
jgi:hypothetical protein